MPYVTYDLTGLTTMSDAARMVGVCPNNYWKWVKEFCFVPPPTIKVGKRHYYDAAGLREVVKTVAKLRAEGRIL